MDHVLLEGGISLLDRDLVGLFVVVGFCSQLYGDRISKTYDSYI